MLFRKISMMKAVEDCHGGDVPTQLQSLKGLGSFGTVENVYHSPLQTIESVKQTLCCKIAKTRAVLSSDPGLAWVFYLFNILI